MSKINFSAPLLNIAGEPFQVKVSETSKDERPMELKDVAIEALLAVTPEQQTGEQKFKQYEISQKIYPGGEVDLLPEDITLIKQRIGMIYGPAIVGPAYKLLNG